MKPIFKLIATGCVLAACVQAPAYATTTYTGTLTNIGTDWNGAGYLFGVSGVTNSCSTGEFETTPSNAGYKEQMATLMLAWSLNEAVTIVTDATDSCAFGRGVIVSVQIASH